MPRDRKGRFTAERTTKTTHEITERITIGEHHHTHNDTAGGPTPIFDALLHKWPSREFAKLETARAATADASRLEAITHTIPDDETAWTRGEFTWDEDVATVARTRIYRELDEDTLAHEFALEPPLDLLP